MQILGTFKVSKYYLNTQILAEHLNTEFKVFKYCIMAQHDSCQLFFSSSEGKHRETMTFVSHKRYALYAMSISMSSFITSNAD